MVEEKNFEVVIQKYFHHLKAYWKLNQILRDDVFYAAPPCFPASIAPSTPWRDSELTMSSAMVAQHNSPPLEFNNNNNTILSTGGVAPSNASPEELALLAKLEEANR
ncbi:hypothetical protein WDU94_000919 [Cyamophila willieti]